jgi:NSS family neurotransmitter:Na+ symporter
MLPLSGLLVAILIGWKIKSQMVEDQLLSESPRLFFAWKWAIKFVSPLAVIVVLVMGIYPRLV